MGEGDNGWLEKIMRSFLIEHIVDGELKKFGCSVDSILDAINAWQEFIRGSVKPSYL